MTATAIATKVKERPILFSSEMVRAILDGRKTQTRRVLKTQPLEILDKSRGQGLVKVTRQRGGHKVWFGLTHRDPNRGVAFRCSYGEVGENLWVRETFFPDPPNNGEWDFYQWTDGRLRNYSAIPERYRNPRHVIYRATQDMGYDLAWSPTIHMPRWASRITLEITNVKVERLQEISEADAIAEGIKAYDNGTFGMDDPQACMGKTARLAFWRGWDHINAKRGFSWSSNPFVWCISFRKL